MKKLRNYGGVVALLLVLVLSISGIIAYFTATDTETNVFEVGKISIDLQEPNWKEVDITPNMTVPKDPQIYNDGSNDAYVFLEVTVPYDNVVTAQLDGTKNEQAWTELITYTVKDGWVEVGKVVTDKVNKVAKHVYAYVGDDESTVEALAKGETTTTLFDTVICSNITENQGYDNRTVDVIVNAYGIQTEIIDDVNTPEGVWDIISNQFEFKEWVSVVATDENGNDLNASSKTIVGSEATTLLDSLEEEGYISSSDEVDALIEVESDDFNGLAETTFDVSSIASTGDQVVILHYDEELQAWEYISTETVDENGEVTADFSSYSPVAFVVLSDEAGLYNNYGIQLASWDELESNYGLDIEGVTSASQTGSLSSVISSGGFSDAYKLIVSDKISSIGSHACSKTTLGEIVLPDNITSIGGYAFAYNQVLNSINIPGNVTSIGIGAFMNTTNLKCEIVIPEGVTSIASKTFSSSSITKLTLPDTITFMGEDAFLGCDFESVDIPPKVTYLAEGVFESTGLREITIPDNITMIGKTAFSYCTNLEKIELPRTVKRLGDGAFKSCTNLQTVVAPGVVTISSGCFDYCTSANSLTLGKDITTIIGSINNFEIVYYEGTEEEWSAVQNSSISFDNSKVVYNYVIE